MDGFLLGLANGAICFSYCAPPLVPYLMGSGRPVRGGYAALLTFLSGRLAGYILFAAVAWATHRVIVQRMPQTQVLSGVTYLLLAGVLLWFGWRDSTPATARCAGSRASRLTAALGVDAPWMVPGLLGLLTGLNLCPPFLVALARATDHQQFLQVLLFFVAFFLGTSVFLVPLPFLGVFRNSFSWRTVGRLAALVVSVFYLYKSVVAFAGSVLL